MSVAKGHARVPRRQVWQVVLRVIASGAACRHKSELLQRGHALLQLDGAEEVPGRIS